jgi:hypothetical protein
MVVSVLTLLALLVAPICAPLCAAQTCLRAKSAIATETHCHGETAASQDGSQIHTVLNCNSSEMPAAALFAGNKSDILQTFRPSSQVAGPHAVSLESTLILAVNSRSRGPHLETLRSFSSFLAIGVLRI